MAQDYTAEEPEPETAEKAAPEADLLEAARAEAASSKDAWMRTAADFANFRKRVGRELDDAFRGGRHELLRALLPVFDDLERAIRSAEQGGDVDVKCVIDGLTKVRREFVDTLARLGIERVPTVGAEFDPRQHDAVQKVASDMHPPGTVVAEAQPGYVDGDRLVRAAKVLVAEARAKDDHA